MSDRRYAIFGGTFDPLHIGHMALAESAASECGLDKLIFMPDYISPFKQDRITAPGRDRYNMIAAAISGRKYFAVSGYEIGRERPSYTIDTLRHWKSMLDGQLCFVLGFDSAVKVDTWCEGAEILRDYQLITAVRPDTDTSEGLAKIESFRKDYSADITVLSMKPVDASSTEIRALIKEGKPVTGLVPPEVEEYIYSHGLYR